ncbi:hypothetical protein N7532_009055 [Penicillium argentinense]|uniref:Uncharacterized protein n=1 Tax=Penicillium argentinense TaxID=1131581 RepID=A0A9W9EYU4_9EURO|nr:uncharacterized protein N7532_009055 [Penicillium argentinense]KAJ5090371.1 hypothetical protein N7532_009055 [Penicillium argentinense]
MVKSPCWMPPARSEHRSVSFAKHNLFDDIFIYDVVHTPGIATDLMHIDTKAKVTEHLPADEGFKKSLKGADIVVLVLTGLDQCIDYSRYFRKVRWDMFWAETRALRTSLSVIGGHSGATNLPLYSQAKSAVNLDDQTLAAVIHRMFERNEGKR